MEGDIDFCNGLRHVFLDMLFRNWCKTCAKINLAKFSRNTAHLGLAKFFPSENSPLYGILLRMCVLPAIFAESHDQVVSQGVSLPAAAGL